MSKGLASIFILSPAHPDICLAMSVSLECFGALWLLQENPDPSCERSSSYLLQCLTMRQFQFGFIFKLGAVGEDFGHMQCCSGPTL